ncbi:hypothetical protein HDU97_004721, partial [Phlyctochytrium planicorne]
MEAVELLALATVLMALLKGASAQILKPAALISASITNDTLYVVDERTSLWKSTDMGRSWTYMYSSIKNVAAYDYGMM